jgi:hypothetical protein
MNGAAMTSVHAGLVIALTIPFGLVAMMLVMWHAIRLPATPCPGRLQRETAAALAHIDPRIPEPRREFATAQPTPVA